jgi:PAS domain-containing protein
MTEETIPPGQMPIELILMRQLASYLAMPVFIVDRLGALVYYNEAAQVLLGKPYEENDEMPLGEWSSAFQPVLEDGVPLSAQDLPLAVALRERRPVHLSPLIMRGGDGVERTVAVTAFPLHGPQHEAGAAAIFWEVKDKRA